MVFIKVRYMTIGKEMNGKNASIQLRHVQYYMRINNRAVKCYEQSNPIIKDIFLSSLISLRNGIVFGTNIWISTFK